MGSRGNRKFSRPGPLPERWLNCPRKSGTLVMNKFLVFKTPLSERFDEQVPQENRFPVDFVFSSMKSYNVQVGLWIDLTNTSRFYDDSDVKKFDCKYVKIQCKGRGETPTPEQAQTFAKICDDYIRRNPLQIIGVHCTHGFNRSGFMIISYLVSMLDWDLDAAVAAFAQARPPGIYKKEYILELYERFSEPQFAPEAPPMPDWCLEFQGEDSDGEEQGAKRGSETSESSPSPRKRMKGREINKSNPTFMEGVGGVEPLRQPQLGEIQRRVQELCGWNRGGFPGCQPISMTMDNIRLLSEKPYTVSWKADGVRYLMYIQGKNEVFCLDRDNSVFQVSNLYFPFRKDLKVHLKDTLVDGEMVIDKVNGVDVPRFLVYDIITILGHPIRNDPFFAKRYKAISLEIIEPRHQAMRVGLINKLSEPFSVRSKEFFDVRDAGKFLSQKFCQTLSHEPDGLIFQPAADPYITGRCDEVLKWKPATLNSVDFRLKIKKEEGLGLLPTKYGELYVIERGQQIKFSTIKPVKNIQHLDNKIIECNYANDRWVFMRERTDKSFPNSYTTAKAVCDSIANPVTKEYLLDYIDHNRFYDEMPPPSGLPMRYSREFS